VRASPEGRDELSERVQRALSLPTKKEAEHVVSAVILSLETTLLTHLPFSLRRLSERHNCTRI
jgi:hypothetical protein